MDWQSFVVELLTLLIWPAVVLVLVIIFRKPLLTLLPQLSRVKYKEIEIEFEKELEHISQQAEQAFPDLSLERKRALIVRAKALPNNAALEAWQVLDDTAELLIHFYEGDTTLSEETRYKHIQQILLDGDYIETKKVKLYDELRQLRNKIAHAEHFSIDPAQSVQYIELCFLLIDYFVDRINTPYNP